MEPKNTLSDPSPEPSTLPIAEAPQTPPESPAQSSMPAVATPPEPAVEKDDALAAVAPDEIQEAEPDEVATPDKPAQITAPIFISKGNSLPEILTSIGFGSLFFAYAAAAFLHPESLQTAFLDNVLGKSIGHAALAVEISMFINLLLGILLLLGRYRTIVYAIAGSWLIVIAAFKVLNLL